MSLQKLYGKSVDDIAKMWGKDILVEGDAALSDVKNGKTFYAGATALKTGNLATVALAAGSNAYPAGYHVGNGGGLDAVDTDLVAANIADGVTIFGVLGTLAAGTLAEDIRANGLSADTSSSLGHYYKTQNISAGTEYEIATTTDTYAADSLAIAFAFVSAREASTSNTKKFRLYMDGVQVAESGFVSLTGDVYLVSGNRALSGSTICKCTVWCYTTTGNLAFGGVGTNGSPCAGAIGIGSVKLV